MICCIRLFMEDHIYSPDGKYVFKNGEWVPSTIVNQETMNINDSAVAGDVVSNTTIQRTEAEVIRAVMNGVRVSISIE